MRNFLYEDRKWIVSLSGETISAEDILEAIGFQEQYFMGELYTLCYVKRKEKI